MSEPKDAAIWTDQLEPGERSVLDRADRDLRRHLPTELNPDSLLSLTDDS
jgi:hypothetical protein